MIKIGYQGIVGSNSEEAANRIASKLNFENVEFLPLVSSKKVIGMLKRNEIDYGVVAVKNSIGGIVQETYDALKTEYIEIVTTEILPIHHCLFVKDENVKQENINQIASHPQALIQCNENIRNYLGDVGLKEIEDTAIGAKYLADGKLNKETAVLCRRNAGESYQLHLLYENFEDRKDNETEFRMFKNNQFDIENDNATLLDKLLYHCITDKGLGIITKGLMIAVIFTSLYFQKYLNWSDYEAATTISGILSVTFLFLTSAKLKNWLRYRSLTGYWKYYSIPENRSEDSVDQKYEVPRVVKIEEVDGELFFKGWMCDKENLPLFKSQKVLLSPLGKRIGSLIYWYNTPTEMGRGFSLNGIVTLNWELNNPAGKIEMMSGWYMGKSTNEIGSLNYSRITKEEFNILRTSDYL